MSSLSLAPAEILLNASPVPVRLAPRTLLFAENDARLGQIVRRQFQRDFVSRHDANEMFAHLTRDVRKHVALAGHVDAKHCSRQYLRNRAFHHDRGFFRHRAETYPRKSLAQTKLA